MIKADTIDNKIEFINRYIKAKNAATGSDVDQNANVSNKNIATMSAELPKKDMIALNRTMVLNKLKEMGETDAAKHYIDDIESHIIYSHDETSIYPYCCSISLYPFVLDGLTKVGGSSTAPHHLDSYCGGICNLIFLVAGQFVGAVAIPEFLMYFDHFARVDYGDDYIHHLDDVIEHKKSGEETLRDRIEHYFAQVVYTINQPAGARGYQSPFINIAYFDHDYFESIFKDFVFPDGDLPKWETTKELQKMFMRWFNKERLTNILTFPVETANMHVVNGKYSDSEMADFFAEEWAEGASFFMYQSDSVDSLSSCCRLRNAVEDNVFSSTLGAGGIETGSKKVYTLNLNRITQLWDKQGRNGSLKDAVMEVTKRVHVYLRAYNEILWDFYRGGILTIYNAGFIDLDRQFLTVGINGFLEMAEFLSIRINPRDHEYQKLAEDVLGSIEAYNRADRSEHCKYNLEFVPAESLGCKNAKWDKRDGMKVNRNCYNSYFYPVEDTSIDPVEKFAYQGGVFAKALSGGSALHNNLDEHLTKEQYRKLMDVAIVEGCPYFTYNVMNTICNKCGHISKHTFSKCPKCGSEDVDYATRVIGYLKRISSFSAARQIEAENRAYNELGHIGHHMSELHEKGESANA